MRTRWICLALLIAGTVTYAACDQQLSTISGPTPNLEPTFSSIQANIFETSDSSGRQSCVTCHTTLGRTPAGGLNLTREMAYDQLIKVAARGKAEMLRVKPGDADQSYLVHKLAVAGDIAGRRMPTGGPPFLTDGQILIIRRWITNGARLD
jgi:hypothetical protein